MITKKQKLFAKKLTPRNKLAPVAMAQGGFFTSKQAEESGYARQNHHYHVKNGDWVREIRGIFRLSLIPEDQWSDYWMWYLWSRGRDDRPRAIYSHYTALSLFGISEVNPAKIDMIVPPNFSKSGTIPKVLRLHKLKINKIEIKKINGIPVLAPLQTLELLAEENETPDEIMEAAVKDALNKGLISMSDIKRTPVLARYAL